MWNMPRVINWLLACAARSGRSSSVKSKCQHRSPQTDPANRGLIKFVVRWLRNRSPVEGVTNRSRPRPATRGPDVSAHLGPRVQCSKSGPPGRCHSCFAFALPVANPVFRLLPFVFCRSEGVDISTRENMCLLSSVQSCLDRMRTESR